MDTIKCRRSERGRRTDDGQTMETKLQLSTNVLLNKDLAPFGIRRRHRQCGAGVNLNCQEKCGSRPHITSGKARELERYEGKAPYGTGRGQKSDDHVTATSR